MKGNGGRFLQTTKDHKGTFTIVGDTVKGQMDYDFGTTVHQCQIAFKPNHDLTLTGTLACNFANNAPSETITAQIF
jgi:hypothetical protein